MFLIKDPSTRGVINNFSGPEIVDIGITYSEGVAVITVTGELDLSNAAWLSQCLHDAIDAGVIEIVLDIEHLTYVDSTGLAILKSAHNRMLATHGKMVILAPAPNVMRLLEVTRLSSVLTIRGARRVWDEFLDNL
jgi:stage II sporulation protein AA (anti-sigma F factor antagonist)